MTPGELFELLQEALQQHGGLSIGRVTVRAHTIRGEVLHLAVERIQVTRGAGAVDLVLSLAENVSNGNDGQKTQPTAPGVH